MTAPFAEGERVLMIDRKKRRYLVTLSDAGEFHSHAGFVAHKLIIGQPEGSTVASTLGAAYVALRPTLADFVIEMPRGAQVIYPKDIGPMLMLGEERTRVLADEWTVVTEDGSLAAHFEHTVAVTEHGHEVLTARD